MLASHSAAAGHPWPAGPRGTARLLPSRPGASWADHLERHGPLPTAAPASIMSAVDAAGLCGRGGGGYPTAVKFRAVAEHGRPSAPPVVIANCCEGDPTSGKDQLLAVKAPHLVIDGAMAAAAAVRSHRVILAVHRGTRTADQLRAALVERPKAHFGVEIREVPERFVASEATALINYFESGDARPLGRLRPAWQAGLDGRPTLVDNAETLAHVALIARFGPQWYRSVGSAAEPGTALVTMGGAVRRPAVLEVAHGTSVRAMLDAAGAPATGWALTGGLAGRWIEIPALGRIGYGTTELAAIGALRGVSSITVLPEAGCLLEETVRILEALAHAGAGQCGPCMFGLPAIAEDMAMLAAGDQGAVDRLRRRLPVINRRGGCSHPDGAVGLAASTMVVLTGGLRAPESPSSGRPVRDHHSDSPVGNIRTRQGLHMRGSSRPMPTFQLDAIGCRAHGLCAEEAPELISLDEWGYPMFHPAQITRKSLRHALSASAACPVRALLIVSGT